MGHNPVRKYWEVPRLWPDSKVFIIGGGPSLKGFDFSLLQGRRVIGCNDAYKLGFPQFFDIPDLVDICYWGDWGWWNIHWNEMVKYPKATNEREHPGLIAFPGLRVNCAERYIDAVGVRCLRRDQRKLCTGDKVGWFHNTGASAINFAILLGAVEIVLLGFDMTVDEDGKHNWHHNLKDQANLVRIERHKRAFHNELAPQLKKKYPDVKIWNTNKDSGINCFPKVAIKDVL